MLNLAKIPKPNLGQYNPGLLIDMLDEPDIAAQIASANNPEYLYYDELKPQTNMEREKFWALIKIQRKFSARAVPPINFNERPFMLVNLFEHAERIYKLTAQKYPANLLNEIIHSAAIEDPEIKIIAAKKFLQEARPAKTEAEKLLKFTQKLYAGSPLEYKPERFRNEDERFIYTHGNAKQICYIAPNSQIFEREWPKFLAYANNAEASVQKAIILHFWTLILNPLPKYSGIFARAVCCWFLQKQGLNLPLSKFIHQNLPAYSRAITLAAQDDNDFTYFQSYMLAKLEQAAKAAFDNKKTSADFERNILPAIQAKHQLNARQAQLLYELSKTRNARTNFSAYMNENKITRGTAATDLKQLERKGYLKTQKIGKNLFYYAGEKAGNLIA